MDAADATNASPSDNDDTNDINDDNMSENDDDLPHKPSSSSTTASAKAAERREQSLGDLLMLMDSYAPLIPDAVTDYYLARSGFQSDDIRVKRLLALAAQKFVSDIAGDALHYCKVRQQAIAAKDKKGNVRKNVLTMDDLSAALQEYGINAKKPEYFTN